MSRGTLRIRVDGRALEVPAGTSASAAVAIAGAASHRRSVAGSPRAPLCGMGVCFECRLTVDGRPGVRGCLTVCADGMEVATA